MTSDLVSFWMDELAPKPKMEPPETFYYFGFGTDGTPPEQRAVLYRAETRSYYEDGTVRVLFCAYRVARYTPCGAWVDLDHFGDHQPDRQRLKFVNLRAGKQWASATRDEALYGLMRRRQRQVRILTAQLASAERELDYLKEMLDED
jgi:hypothetical protein